MRDLAARLLARLPLGDVTILIRDGTAVLRRGRVRPALLSELSELAATQRLGTVCLHVSNLASGPRIRFFGVPEELRQRFRNCWTAFA